MYSPELNDFIDDCFIAKDPICELKKQELLELDPFTYALIEEITRQDSNKSK